MLHRSIYGQETVAWAGKDRPLFATRYSLFAALRPLRRFLGRRLLRGVGRWRIGGGFRFLALPQRRELVDELLGLVRVKGLGITRGRHVMDGRIGGSRGRARRRAGRLGEVGELGGAATDEAGERRHGEPG